eukprot:3030118-Karenia_brevis.AAC.1
MVYLAGWNIKEPIDFIIQLKAGLVLTTRAVEELKVLGIMLERRGSTAHSIDHRFQRAKTVYWQIVTILRNRTSPVEERLKAWAEGPMGSASYGCR